MSYIFKSIIIKYVYTVLQVFVLVSVFTCEKY